MRTPEVHDLSREDLPLAVGVLARGMRDNPVHVAAYGDDPDRRLRHHGRLVGGLLTAMPDTVLLGARHRGALVGVAGAAPEGACRPTAGQRLRMLPHLVGLGPSAARRVLAWTHAWAAHDPAEPHVHIGPVAVDTHAQGLGYGTALLREVTRRLDVTGAVGYLETDKEVNVGFYERVGFAVVGRLTVLGVPTWLMRRPAS